MKLTTHTKIIKTTEHSILIAILGLSFVASSSFLLTGCISMSVAKLDELPLTTTHNVTINDLRDPSQKKFYHDNEAEPIATWSILGDTNFEPAPLDYLRAKLENESAKTEGKYIIDVSTFKIIYNYGFSYRLGMSSVMAGAVAGTKGVYAPVPVSDKYTDFIRIEFKGRVNGHDLSLESTQPFRASMGGLMNIMHDENLRAAVGATISEIATKIVNSNY